MIATYASTSPPTTDKAIRTFRNQNRRHITVKSLFLTPSFLYDRAAELALEAGAITMSQPFSADPEVTRTVLTHYLIGAVELVPVWHQQQ